MYTFGLPRSDARSGHHLPQVGGISPCGLGLAPHDAAQRIRDGARGWRGRHVEAVRQQDPPHLYGGRPTDRQAEARLNER